MLDPLPQLLRNQGERPVESLPRLKRRLFRAWSGRFQCQRRGRDEPRELVVVRVGERVIG